MSAAEATSLQLEPMTFDVNGTETVVLTAGDPAAPPLVFLHGGGTWHGWGFLEPWTAQHRVLLPIHPGFGASGDLDDLREVHDLVLHYIDLFDQLGLTSGVDVVGFSVGGLLAARFAIEQKHRLRRLVLVAPAGLRVPHVHVDDYFAIPPEEVGRRLVHRPETLQPHLPDDPNDVDFIVERYRELRTMAQLLWEHPFDRVVPAGSAASTCRRSSCGAKTTSSCPAAMAPAWAALLPDATVATFPEAGHLVLDESPAAVAAVTDFCAVG